MKQSCPISENRVNSIVVRVVAMQVAIIAFLLILTKHPIFAVFLFIDFLLRYFKYERFSPLVIVAKYIIKVFSIKPNFVDEAPKRFALAMGLAISMSLVILYIFKFYVVGMSITIVLLICALLEALFDYCVGCKIYNLLIKVI